MGNGKKQNTGLVGTLDFHEYNSRENRISRTRAHVSEKDKGVQMIDQIKSRFNLSDRDIKEIQNKQIYAEAREQLAFAKNKPIEWKRDDRGNII